MTRTLLCLLALTFTLPAQADIGVRRAKKVTDGIYRGPRPDQADFDAMARAGVRTVIDLQGKASKVIPGETLRARQQRRAMSERAGLRHYNIPTTLSRIDEPTEQEELLRIAALMNEPGNQPVYVHCAAGKDRTGMAVAVYRILYQGCSYAQARKEFVRHGIPLWTPALMGKQFKFLREVESKARPTNQRCPL